MINYLKNIKQKYAKEIAYLRDIDHVEKYDLGNTYLANKYHQEGEKKIASELKKTPYRYDVINYLLKTLNKPTNYLEIGVRYPEENFKKIKADYKFSVDPGLENAVNPVDFKLTSDVFFEKIRSNEILQKNIKFDVIFIDGLHLAEQVERDIENSLEFLNKNGFIVLHDCNPPTEYHACETYEYRLSPSKDYWNGTTWKAFFKHRQRKDVFSCCIDSDWGIGIISKNVSLGSPTKVKNSYFEFSVFSKYRKDSLNLITFNELKKILNK